MNINISVQLFAGIRQAIGEDAITVQLLPGASVGDLAVELSQQYPEVGSMIATSQFAIGNAYVANDVPLADGQVVACIPPVSGG